MGGGAFTNRGNAISGHPASRPQKTPVGTLCFLYHHLSAFSAFSARSGGFTASGRTLGGRWHCRRPPSTRFAFAGSIACGSMGERTLTAARLPDSAGGCGRKAADQKLSKS